MFNVYFNIAALLFLGIICWRFFSQRQFPTLDTRLFGMLLVLAISDIAMDTISVFALDNLDVVPHWVFYASNSAYYALQVALPSAILQYLLASLQPKRHFKRRIYNLALIPMAAFELVLLVGIPAGWVFGLTEAGTYVRGPLSIITYASTMLYLLVTFAVLVKNVRNLSDEFCRSIMVFLPLLTAGVVFQYLFPQVLLTGIAMASGFMIIFFTMHDPSRMIDNATGAFNFNALLMFLQTRAMSSRLMSIAFIDVHGLRYGTVSNGSRSTDMALIQISRRISDIDRKRVWIFRTASSRFVVVTLDNTLLYKVLAEIRSMSGQEWIVPGGSSIQLTLSACYAIDLSKFASSEELLSAAEVVLAVQRTNNQKEHIQEIDETMLEVIHRRDKLEGVLRQCIDDESGFTLYYQPIYNCKQARFDAAEALLRFEHPLFGMVSPGEFMPIVEASGLAVKLDELVVRLAFKDVQRGLFEGLELDHIHINLSSASFATQRVTRNISNYLDEFGIDPQFISLEITESTAVNSRELVSRCMEMLREKGIRWALDDFGTGYSNFLRLTALHFDIVKIDKSLLDCEPFAYQGLIELLQHMTPELISEGVETGEQVRFVTGLGVGSIQGFHYSKPLPASELRAFLSNALTSPVLTVRTRNASEVREVRIS